LLSKALFVVPLINSVITFMEANSWQNVKHAEQKLLHRGRNGLWQAEPTKQERKPSWKLDFSTAQNAKKPSAPP